MIGCCCTPYRTCPTCRGAGVVPAGWPWPYGRWPYVPAFPVPYVPTYPVYPVVPMGQIAPPAFRPSSTAANDVALARA